MTTRGPAQGQIELCWARDGEGWAKNRCLKQKTRGGGKRLYTFDVAKHQEWSGVIKPILLRLRPKSESRLIEVWDLSGWRHEIVEAKS